MSPISTLIFWTGIVGAFINGQLVALEVIDPHYAGPAAMWLIASVVSLKTK